MKIQPPASNDGGLLIKYDNMTAISGSTISDDEKAMISEGSEDTFTAFLGVPGDAAFSGDTIAAISTVPGDGAIGIVRISGGGSKGILSRIFRRGSFSQSVSSVPPARERIVGHEPAQSPSIGSTVSPARERIVSHEPAQSQSASSSAGECFASHAPEQSQLVGSTAEECFASYEPEQSQSASSSAGECFASYEPEQSQSVSSASEEYPRSKLMYHGYIQDPKGETVDEVLAVFMKGPHTYTGEDTAEIHCHGSIIALKKTLELVLKEGASAAMPGEFTKRAFLNGRLDLAQAEAVIDLIKAKTDITFNAAIQQLEGSLSAKLGHIRSMLLDILVRITVDLDYPEEDEPDLAYEEVIRSISEIKRETERLTDTIDTGRIISQGLRTVIAGKPNVGKSSLLNGLLREARAIVTEIPGTTRDTIEEDLNIKGIPIRIIDTAGIRDTDDRIEKIGVEKSREAFNSADLVLFVTDVSIPLSAEDREIAFHVGERPVIAVLNKSDLEAKVNVSDVKALLPAASVIRMSLLDGWGLDELENEIAEFVFRGQAVQRGDVLVTNARQGELLLKAADEIGQGLVLAKIGGAMELIEFNLRQAYEFLGEIIGETVGDNIIDEVFARFCLGK